MSRKRAFDKISDKEEKEVSENDNDNEPPQKRQKTTKIDRKSLPDLSTKVRVLGKYKNIDMELYEFEQFYFLKWKDSIYTLRDYCAYINNGNRKKPDRCDITLKEALKWMFGIGKPINIFIDYHYKPSQIDLYKGKYGHYLKYKDKNYSIPKHTQLPTTFKQAMNIIENKNKSVIIKFNDEISLRKNDKGNYYIMIKKHRKKAKFINLDEKLLSKFENRIGDIYYDKITFNNIESMSFEFCQQIIAYHNQNYREKSKWNNYSKWRHLDGPDHFGDRSFSYKYYRCCACNKRTDGECFCGHICSNGCL